jgi:lactoylglutathione lyase
MKFAYTILYVESVANTLKFYQDAFGFQQRFLHEAGDYGELETGNTVLAFSSHALMRQLGKKPTAADANAPCFELAVSTDDVAHAVQRALLAGAQHISEPKQMPWGQTIAYVADPNGFLIEICTPMGQ